MSKKKADPICQPDANQAARSVLDQALAKVEKRETGTKKDLVLRNPNNGPSGRR